MRPYRVEMSDMQFSLVDDSPPTINPIPPRHVCCDTPAHAVLGISRDATPAQIKKSYKKLALRHHPDKVRGDARAKADANAKFAAISHAYELLTRGGGNEQEGGGSSGGAYQPDAADVAAGYAPGQAQYQQYRQQSMPFTGFGLPGMMGFGGGGGGVVSGGFMDPFGAAAFGGLNSFFGGAMNPMGGMGQAPFPGFQFTDPFDLFRQTFGDDFGLAVGGGDPFGAAAQSNAALRNGDVAGMPPTAGGLFSTLLGGAAMGASGMPLNAAQGNFTSYSYSSGGGCGGMVQTLSTTTTINDGKRVTRTERTTINPDGTRQTTVDLTGDDDERPMHLLEQGRAWSSATEAEATDAEYHGRKRKFVEVTRCLKCCFPTLRKRRRIGDSERGARVA